MNESCSERFKLYIVTMRFKILDKFDLYALVQFCRSVLTNNFKSSVNSFKFTNSVKSFKRTNQIFRIISEKLLLLILKY